MTDSSRWLEQSYDSEPDMPVAEDVVIRPFDIGYSTDPDTRAELIELVLHEAPLIKINTAPDQPGTVGKHLAKAATFERNRSHRARHSGRVALSDFISFIFH